MSYNLKNIEKLQKLLQKKKYNADVIKKRGKHGLRIKMSKISQSHNRVFSGGLVSGQKFWHTPSIFHKNLC